MAIRIELLGKMRLTVDGVRIASVNTSRLQALLAALVLNQNVPQSRAGLALKLWPESNDAQARTNLRQLIHHLRRALPVDNLESDNHAICWRQDQGGLDVAEFELALESAARHEIGNDFGGARRELERALELYKDDLLPDLNDEWLVIPREHLRIGYIETFMKQVRLKEAENDLEGALRDASKLLALDPLREATYLALMRLSMRNGNRAATMRIYHQCLRTLRRELGASPCREIEDLYNQALNADGASIAGSTVSETPHNSRLPLVGRLAELQEARSFLQRTSGSRFVLIGGEPGIGKSRLAEELTGPQTATAHCYFGQGRIAFGPLGELLRSSIFPPQFGGLGKTRLAELARVLPELLAENNEIKPPQTIAEGWQKLHFFEAVNAAIEMAPRPLVLLFEDLHWCDADTLDWLSAMFRAKLAGDIVVIGTARLGELDRSHPLNALRHEARISEGYLEISLSPLDHSKVSELAVQVRGGECESAYVENVFKATKGNPLFVVETVRADLEANSQDRIPVRLQAVIEQRLAHASSGAFELTEFAAMFGRPFSSELLASAADWDEESVADALDELGRRLIIELNRDGEFDFTHALLRDVAHRGISAVRRRSLDAKIARSLEDFHGLEPCPASLRIASHYEASGKTGQAIPHFRNAAMSAQGRFDETEALELLQHAVTLCKGLPRSEGREAQELELLAMLGPSLVAAKGYSAPAVGEIYERALVLSRKTGVTSHTFALLSGSWLFNIVRGNIRESQDIALQCLDWGRSEPAIEKASNLLLGISLFHLGQLSEARERIEYATPTQGESLHPALALFGGPDLGVFCRSYLSYLHWHEGSEERSAEVSSEALALGRESAHPFSLAVALDYAALLASFQQDPVGAFEYAQEASNICARYGFPYYGAWAEILAGWASTHSGDYDSGPARIRLGLDTLADLGAELRLPYYYALLADAYILSSRSAEAFAALATGLSYLKKNDEIWTDSMLERVRLRL